MQKENKDKLNEIAEKAIDVTLKKIDPILSSGIERITRILNINESYNELRNNGVDPIPSAIAIGTKEVIKTTLNATAIVAASTSLPGLVLGTCLYYNSNKYADLAKKGVLFIDNIMNKCRSLDKPIGSDWKEGAFGEYYRNNNGTFEKYSNGRTYYVSKIDPSIPIGGVSLENEQISNIFQNIKLSDEISSDPISIIDNTLTYKNVKYIVPNINNDELATALFIIFFLKPKNINISLDNIESKEYYNKIFNPSFLHYTNLGRNAMKADEILKNNDDLIADNFVKLEKKKEFIHFRKWYDYSNINYVVDKKNNIVTFDDNNMLVVTDTKESFVIDAVNEFNKNLSNLINQNIEVKKIKYYMNLFFLCRLLYFASNALMDESVTEFINNNMIILNDNYEFRIKTREIMRNNKLVMTGGVSLMGSCMNINNPWRKGDEEKDLLCISCDWKIEDYMPRKKMLGQKICMECYKIKVEKYLKILNE